MKILVLAGGFDQIALINELKLRGHYVILADYFENPPAKNYADEHFVVSTLDTDKIYELAKSKNVELITTACTDQALLTVALASEQLNLKTYIDYQTALNVTNKLYMKDIFKKNNIQTADYKVVAENEDFSDINLNFPLVVKPVDCNSSKGVKKVENELQLEEYLTNAIELSRTKTAIVEEFKEGIEVSIDAFIHNGISEVLSITQTGKLKNGNNFTIYKSEYSPDIMKNYVDVVKNIVQNIANAFNLKNCPLLVQAIINENKVFVLEFSARMGGGTKYRLINEISGIDIIKLYTDLILNEQIKYEINTSSDHIKLNYIYCENGEFKELNGFEEAKNDKLIEDYFQYKTEGMIITKMETSSDRAAGYLIKGTNQEIEEKEEVLKQKLKVLDKNGKNIMKYYF